jgi:hypothetical protein
MNDLLSPAERNEVETRSLCGSIKANFLQVGRLLYASFTNGYWGQCGHESWSDYLESLGIGSRSWVSRLVRVAMCVETQTLAEADVIDMGVSCAVLLLPTAEKGGLTQDLIEVAKSGDTRELREALGHKLIENDKDCFLLCPRCGSRITGAKFVRKSDA